MSAVSWIPILTLCPRRREAALQRNKAAEQKRNLEEAKAKVSFGSVSLPFSLSRFRIPRWAPERLLDSVARLADPKKWLTN